MATSLPSGYALAIILGCRGDPQSYAMHFYYLYKYKATYSNLIIHPLIHDIDQPLTFNFAKYLSNVQEELEESNDEDLEPPNIHPPTRRPKRKRIRRIIGDEISIHISL